MQQKKKYTAPEVTTVIFITQDIITTSSNGGIELPDHLWDILE